MSAKYYGKGDHPAGFIGYRVTAVVKDKYRQRYLSTTDPRIRFQDDRCPFFKRQRLRAEILDAEWLAESALHQYHKFVTSNHSSTSPYQGTGVHGLTCRWIRDRRGEWQAGFAINLPKTKRLDSERRGFQFFSFRTRLYSEVWALCVNLWADHNDILEADRLRVLSNPPPPNQFADLRRQLNEEGADIPVEKLGPVFAEQRQKLKAYRAEKALAPVKSTNDADSKPHHDLEHEIASWFQKEVSR
ncbi:hypothetical protein [Marinobacter salicampi]|uniref:hypothetical protein n=1 Tax=Marinobacter salicampi TaxID=435907 RepID=UPI00140816C2|nr:hypothetical protein [Marinobacter salicampi]